MNSELGWYTAGDLARLRLPGLPHTDQGIRKMANRQRWESKEVPGRGPSGVERLYKPTPRVLEQICKSEQAQHHATATPAKVRPNLVAREERVGYVVIRDQDGREVDELVMVPRLDVLVSGGHGATVHSEQIVDSLAFKAAWVRANGLQPSRLALVEAVGESMQPTIQRGDLLLVDLRVNHPAQEGLFVIRRDDTLQVKRLQQLYTGEILVRSDNPAYVAENIPPDRAGELQIIGRVVWTCRRI